VRKVDLAWAAGIVDGEGCLSRIVTKNPRGISMSLVVVTSMVHRPTISRLQKIVGGKIPYPKRGKRKPREKQQWTTYVLGRDAIRAIELLHPYLVTKKKIASLWLLLGKQIGPRGSNTLLSEKERSR
jgi:hypothetical protein